MNGRKIREINVKDISLDKAQPRQETTKLKLKELALDIKERGLIYPIIVTPYLKKGDNLILGEKALDNKERKWWLLDGERRVRAYTLSNLKQIEAEVRLDLNYLEMLEIQFASNTKRIQITVEEMAKAITRFKLEFLKQNPTGDVLKRLIELTGYSHTYFDMAEAINRASKPLRDKIYEGKVGGYTPAEIERASGDISIRKGITNAYLNSEKSFSALVPRALKQDFKKIATKKHLSSNEKEALAENLVRKFISKGDENMDAESDFIRYIYEAENFFDEIKRWKMIGLKLKELNQIIALFEAIKNYFVEERRKLHRLRTVVRSKNIKK